MEATLQKPIRVQLKRTKGWRIPPNTVIVDRRTKWGNPFRLQKLSDFGNGAKVPPELARACAVANYRNYVDDTLWKEIQAELRGKNLACWCPPHHQCHADVLLEIANENT